MPTKREWCLYDTGVTILLVHNLKITTVIKVPVGSYKVDNYYAVVEKYLVTSFYQIVNYSSVTTFNIIMPITGSFTSTLIRGDKYNCPHCTVL